MISDYITKKYNNRIERLISIMFETSPNTALTVTELADVFGVCRKTIKRDIDILSKCGFAVHDADSGKVRMGKLSYKKVNSIAKKAGIV